MLQSELHELDEIKGLVTKGQQQGVLSYNEVADAVAEIDLDEADVDAEADRRLVQAAPDGPLRLRQDRLDSPDRRRPRAA